LSDVKVIEMMGVLTDAQHSTVDYRRVSPFSKDFEDKGVEMRMTCFYY
jgi:hypothetical protein